MKEGTIIFLTKRKFRHPFEFRWWLSILIAYFTKDEKQKLSDVKVHAAIIYDNGGLKVRDIDKEGDCHYILKDYLSKYEGRIEIKEHSFNICEDELKFFNYSCKTRKVKYDYINTFFYQIIKYFIGIFTKKNTIEKRMCSEDVMRQFNLLKCIFNTPEKTTPNELYLMIKKWKTVKKC